MRVASRSIAWHTLQCSSAAGCGTEMTHDICFRSNKKEGEFQRGIGRPGVVRGYVGGAGLWMEDDGICFL